MIMIVLDNSKLSHKKSIQRTEELDRRRRRRWKRRIKVRAEKVKRQLGIENRFHNAMAEIRTTSDNYRRSYLHWILQQMFTLFDYETGLHAINDKAAYRSWLSENLGHRHNK
jgi:hypothetical protein